MHNLNNHPGVEAIESGVSLVASGYMSAEPRAYDDGISAIASRLRRWTNKLVSRCGMDKSHAVANFLRSLDGRIDWLSRPSRRRKMAAKYIVRALCMPQQHGRHLAFVSGNPRMSAYRCRDPRILERHFHRYMHLQWGRRKRLQSIQQHYRFALNRLHGVLFEAIYVYGNATLGYLTLKDGTQLKLCLRPPISLGCEGELCIQLSDLNDHPVYRLVLSVIDDQPTIAIGCIQGPDGEYGKDRVRELTKNMYGMRPKQLMLSLAYAFAQHFGIRRMLAVSNTAHPLRGARDRFQADYDAFWLEQKGSDVGDGWFSLPETLSRKSEAEVPSNHRSAFRRREAMRIHAEQLLTDALAAYPPRKTTPRMLDELESARSFQHDDLDASWMQ